MASAPGSPAARHQAGGGCDTFDATKTPGVGFHVGAGAPHCMVGTSHCWVTKFQELETCPMTLSHSYESATTGACVI